ncbi:MAG: TRAP transporter small permease [Alphaproteobacteria bacterium]|nr:TRAP transporter small permease [Alphaproteobacteria bacterium]
MERWVRTVESAVGWLSRIANGIAALACLLTLALVCYAVAMRYFVGRPLTWGDEVAGYLVVVTVMLGVAEAQRRGENIGVDVVDERSRFGLVRLVGALSALAVGVCAWLFLWEGLQMVAFSRMIGIMSNVLPGLPMWTVQIAVPLGGVLLLLVAAVQLACWLAGLWPRGLDTAKPGDPGHPLRGHE